MQTTCPCCHSTDAHTYLGTMRERIHLRCRSCGTDFNVAIDELPEDDDNDA